MRGDRRAEARRVVNPTALLDTWIEENRDSGVRRLGVYVLPPRADEPANVVAERLREHNIDHALTGVAAAVRRAPFLTSFPAATFWIDANESLEHVVPLVSGEEADSGANILLMQAKNNTPLVFAEDEDGIRLANIFRIYHDARRDRKRGAEQAEHLRQEVIGW